MTPATAKLSRRRPDAHLACPPPCLCLPCVTLPSLPCRYVSEHTVAFWAASYVQDLARSTRSHVAMKCYGLGLGLDTFRWGGAGESVHAHTQVCH